MQAELLFAAHDTTGECPVWDAQSQQLFWVDIPNKKLQCLDPLARKHQQWLAPEMIGCITREATNEGLPGNWLAAMESGFFSINPQSGASDLDSTLLAPVNHPAPQMRFNDGRCDRQGRFVAGSMQMNQPKPQAIGQWWVLRNQTAQLLTIENEAQAPRAITTNGMAFSPDGKTLYLSDSNMAVQTVWAFDYFGEHEPMPVVRNRRVFVDMNLHPGRPDGASMDADGCYWICAIEAGFVFRFTPEGKLDKKIKVPVKKPTMCAFGGPNLDLLFITSISEAQSSTPDLEGGLFVARPGVQGCPETPFSWR